ncbi:MAG TPA: DUF4388 domain-containing protein [Thermoanaerobaculia bacterium]|jgi:hypothetical protein|nr:DUF4388 domain-containing protein [Thermoanaerobaculia bacterium]
MADTPIFEGDLRRIQVADVLTFVSMIRGSGKLVLRNGRLERTIFWKDGDIAFVSSNSTEQSLGQFLLRNGKITAEQYDESAARVGPNVRHGKALVQMGAISPNDLWWGMKNQALEIVYSLFTWTEGTFTLLETAEEIVHERIVLSINASSAIMEGIRRLDETARIREKITSLEMVFAKVAGAMPNFQELEMNDDEIAVYNNLDGKLTVRGLIGKSELTDFEVTRILFQLHTARLIEEAPDEKGARPIFLDVEDSPELLKIISTYNDMFGRLYESLASSVGEDQARDLFMTALESAASEDLWNGVFFDQYGRFDENMLIANVSELPFERRRGALEEGLNALLSVQLFEVSQHLDAEGKLNVYQFISDQKALLETA